MLFIFPTECTMNVSKAELRTEKAIQNYTNVFLETFRRDA